MSPSQLFILFLFVLLQVCLLGFYVTEPPEPKQPSLIVNEDLDRAASPDDLSLKFEKPADPKAPWIEQVSWEPRVFVYHNILTKEEANEIINIGEKDLSESLVVAHTGGSTKNEARTSNGVFLGAKYMKSSPLLRSLERRASDFTHLPMSHGEVFYLLRYEEGQQYKPHLDWFSDDDTGRAHIGISGNRIATVLFYLHTPDEGGETIFPAASKGSIEVKANAGDAVLFWDYLPDGTPDGKSLHGGKPVIKGVKWAMTKWIRANPSPYSWRYSLSAEELAQLEAEEFEWLKQTALSR